MSMCQSRASAIALQNYISSNFLTETASFSWITLYHTLLFNMTSWISAR